MDLEAEMTALADRYPPRLRTRRRNDVARNAYHVRLVLAHRPAVKKLLDIGGGEGLFVNQCGRLGLDVTNLDDHGDHHPEMEEMLALQRECGVTNVFANFLEQTWSFPPESFDAVTCFASLEHLHHSPRASLHRACETLRPGGLFVLATPNCCGLWRRLQFLCGVGHWSRFEEWYGETPFRGHVREPNQHDLRAIARDLGLENTRIVGRNYMGFYHPTAWKRVVTHLIDPLLRLRKGLCADLYLIGTKPAR